MEATHNLILFEGLPGTGKSSLSQWLARECRQQQIPVTWYWEMNGQFGSEDWLRPEKGRNPNWQEDFLEGWERFLARLDPDVTTLMDGVLFNKSLLHLFAAGFDVSEISELAVSMLERVATQDPLIIYLQSTEVADHMLRVFEIRGEEFEHNLSRWVERTAYGESQNLTGVQGCLRFWQNYAGFMDRLYDQLPAQKLSLDTHADHWPAYQERLALSLGLDYQAEEATELKSDPTLPGRYQLTFDREGGEDRFCQLTAQFDRFVVEGLSTPLEEVSILLPLQEDLFEIRGQDTRLIRETGGKDTIFKVESSWGRLDGARLRKVA